ncbi:MAG: hypothetical protein V3V61_03190 [Gammaproteobacteria bacterium]
MPIRTIKPSLPRHIGLFEAEEECGLPLRLAFTYLLLCGDREGRFRWQPRELKLDIMPYDDIDFSRVLEALADYKFITKYQHGEEFYGWVPTWHKHQRINSRAPASQLPAPPPKTPNVENHLENNNLNTNVSSDVCTATSCTTSQLPETETTSTVDEDYTENNNSNTDESSCISNTMPCTCKAMPCACKAMSCMRGSGNGSGNGSGSGKGNEVVALATRRLSVLPVPLQKNASPGRVLENPADTSAQNTDYIFDHWRRVMNHPRAGLSSERRVLIEQALKWGYSVADLCQAINGCAKTPHNRGENPQGQRYDGLSVIFKSEDQIDRFIRNCNDPPLKLNKADQNLHENIEVARDWIEQNDERGKNNEPK